MTATLPGEAPNPEPDMPDQDLPGQAPGTPANPGVPAAAAG